MPSDETFFVTGFPGFIAGRLVERLARGRARFLLLVQPAFAARAREEIARIFGQAGAGLDGFRLMEGDITREDLGLSAADLEAARRGATAVFHLAAVYDLAVSRELGERVNVEGTRNVNRLALSLPRQALPLRLDLLRRGAARGAHPRKRAAA